MRFREGEGRGEGWRFIDVFVFPFIVFFLFDHTRYIYNGDPTDGIALWWVSFRKLTHTYTYTHTHTHSHTHTHIHNCVCYLLLSVAKNNVRIFFLQSLDPSTRENGCLEAVICYKFVVVVAIFYLL